MQIFAIGVYSSNDVIINLQQSSFLSIIIGFIIVLFVFLCLSLHSSISSIRFQNEYVKERLSDGQEPKTFKENAILSATCIMAGTFLLMLHSIIIMLGNKNEHVIRVISFAFICISGVFQSTQFESRNIARIILFLIATFLFILSELFEYKDNTENCIFLGFFFLLFVVLCVFMNTKHSKNISEDQHSKILVLMSLCEVIIVVLLVCFGIKSEISFINKYLKQEWIQFFIKTFMCLMASIGCIISLVISFSK
jgi:hypothetical protein